MCTIPFTKRVFVLCVYVCVREREGRSVMP